MPREGDRRADHKGNCIGHRIILWINRAEPVDVDAIGNLEKMGHVVKNQLDWRLQEQLYRETCRASFPVFHTGKVTTKTPKAPFHG